MPYIYKYICIYMDGMGCVMVPEQDAKTFHDSPEGCKKTTLQKNGKTSWILTNNISRIFPVGTCWVDHETRLKTRLVGHLSEFLGGGNDISYTHPVSGDSNLKACILIRPCNSWKNQAKHLQPSNEVSFYPIEAFWRVHFYAIAFGTLDMLPWK